MKKILLYLLLISISLGSIYATYKVISFLNEDIEIETTPIACDVINSKDIYLAVGENYYIDNEIYTVNDIVSVLGNKITANSVGTYNLKLSDCEYLNIIVSDLYTYETINYNKEYLPSDYYSKQDNIYLDNVLKYLINEKGYQTRAGAVEAARFLLLRFKYKLDYFFENGRLYTGVDDPYCDGEGRYYHKGLYLNEYKYDELDTSINGPAIWGNYLYSSSRQVDGTNGLDCSGFITWALYNAGYDCQDLGAGISEDTKDLTDLGKLIYLDELDIDSIKVGDLVGFDGHIGMIIGLDKNHIYIGQAYWDNDLEVVSYTYKQFMNDTQWEYVVDMDEYYLNDGNLKNMWN